MTIVSWRAIAHTLGTIEYKLSFYPTFILNYVQLKKISVIFLQDRFYKLKKKTEKINIRLNHK